MHFRLLDRVLEKSADRIVTIKQVSAAEEYLQDHFPEFPVLPGVFMVESLVQAARELAGGHPDLGRHRLVLGGVRAVKYGSFVRPGETLRVEVTLHKLIGDGSAEFKGEGVVLRHGAAADAEPPVAVSGRFTLRPVRVE
ncbi:MAG: polyketide synthase dehydratase domain-containing protein [Phycisphaerales bacterium]|nr:polyketide synthase dehydratase domain-containing protein [Phycisphaerales bacterium]